jgi:hypothetical protein
VTIVATSKVSAQAAKFTLALPKSKLTPTSDFDVALAGRGGTAMRCLIFVGVGLPRTNVRDEQRERARDLNECFDKLGDFDN